MRECSPSRATWAEVNFKALEHNFSLARRHVGGRAGILAVVKADAYGHGATAVSRRLARLGASAFGVATLEEAEALRRAGLRQEIMILGPLDPCWLKRAARLKIGVTAWSRKYLDTAARTAPGLNVHLKIDTGMNRLGFRAEEAPVILGDFLSRRWKGLRLSSAYTHFSSADQARDKATLQQLRRFLSLAWPDGLRLHACNSAAMLKYPQAWLDLVRPGILLYGALDEAVHPLAKSQRPVLSFKTRVVAAKNIKKGETISYGGTFKARRPMKVGVLGAGYADGVPRALSNRGEVLIQGRRCPIVGRVCMDLLMADMTGLPNAAPGMEAVLIGSQGREEVRAAEWAQLCGTISYEILCGISDRVPRVCF